MVYQQVVDSDVVPGRAPLLPTNETRVALQQEDLQEATPSVTDDDADTDAGRQQPFFATFIKTRGPPQIVVLILLLVIGVFSTVGVVPAVVTDRYARLNYGYMGDRDCSTFDLHDKPIECIHGAADAQNSAATATMVSNILTFLGSSLMGSLSDEYGRRVMLMASICLFALPQLALSLLLFQPNMSPFWYYTGVSLSGLINWIAIVISAMADVIPPASRVAAFGIAMAGYALGMSVAPLLALLGHVPVAILSVTAMGTGLLTVVVWLPETLPPETALQARVLRSQQVRTLNGSLHHCQNLLWWMYRPFWELSVLNRSYLFRLLSVVVFCSDAGNAGVQTLLVYYVEERLNFKDADIATMYLSAGLLGIVVQAFVVKHVNDWFGERKVLLIAYTMGMSINLLYAFATKKSMIFTGITLGAFVDMAYPTMSAIKSNNADPSEQGRIQGAFYSLTALATAFGPSAMRIVFSYTKDGGFLGAGSMFVVLSGLYGVAFTCSYALPLDGSTTRCTNNDNRRATERVDINVETPLLQNALL